MIDREERREGEGVKSLEGLQMRKKSRLESDVAIDFQPTTANQYGFFFFKQSEIGSIPIIFPIRGRQGENQDQSQPQIQGSSLSLSLILLNPFLILILLLSPRLSTVPPRTFQTQLASLSSAPATALPAYVESLADASSKVNQALGGEPKSQQRDQVLDWLNRIDKDGERITEDLKVSRVNREEKMGEI